MEQDVIHRQAAGYALDALSPREREEFEAHLEECASCRTDVGNLREAAAALAAEFEPAEPPPQLRERVLAAARRERPNVTPLLPRWALAGTAALAAAAACAALALGIWASSLSRSLDREREASRERDAALAVLASPGAARVTLPAQRGQLVVERTGRAALVLRGLERAAEGRIYEAWVVAGGRPVPAGLFEGGDETTLVLLERPVPRGAAVAVTLERDGGADQPTGDPLFSARVARTA